MRRICLFLAFLIAACPSAKEDALGTRGDDDNGGAGGGTQPPQHCSFDGDCALAAATCCDCPTFAVNVSDPAHRACTGVTCPPDQTCPDNVYARCGDSGTCELACTELACSASCADGFAIDDATGCLSCACAVPADGGCTMDSDCVETREDCCGCHAGGADTAVLASERSAFDAMLACPPSPQCPSIDVCEAGAGPHCVQGRCELARTTGFSGAACGRNDLPACPGGYVCTVNADPHASKLGVGVCVPQI